MDPHRFDSRYVRGSVCHDWRVVRVLRKLRLHPQPIFYLIQSCSHHHHYHPLRSSRCARIQPTFRARPEWNGCSVLHVPRNVRRWQSHPREVQPLPIRRGERHTHLCPSPRCCPNVHCHRVFHHTRCNAEPCFGGKEASRRDSTVRRP